MSLIELRRAVGMVFQRPNPLPISVYENVVFGLRIHTPKTQLKRSVLDEAVEKALTEVGLWKDLKDRLNAKATGLLLEQQQKLCMARLLPLKPEVILMDEPASALDVGGTRAIEELMFELAGRYTIVIVTHNMAQARRASDSASSCSWGRWSSTPAPKTSSSTRRTRGPRSTSRGATRRSRNGSRGGRRSICPGHDLSNLPRRASVCRFGSPPGTIHHSRPDPISGDPPPGGRPAGVAVAKADRVICSSEATMADCAAAGIGPDRLRHVPLGVDATEVSSAEIERVRHRYLLPDEFVLFVGTLEPRKNLARLVAAIGRNATLPLVVVGMEGWGEQRTLADSNTLLLGFVPDEDLAPLYAAAGVFAYPSEREGFGLPVLEALAQGTPVVTSRGTSTEEVAGGAAVLVDPFDVDSIADGLTTALRRRDGLATLGRARAAQLTWRSSAEGTLAVYRELAT